MGVKLSADASINVDPDDMCAMLTDQLCDDWGAMGAMEVTAVRQSEAGRFEIFFEPKPKQEKA